MVRLLPPLIVSDEEIAEGVRRLERACARIAKAQEKPQKLAATKDRYPAVIAEVRGEGLLVGLRTLVPNGDLVNELHREKMITVAAGDNVVRLLPPLIVSEQEIADAVGRIERACERIRPVPQEPRQGAAR